MAFLEILAHFERFKSLKPGQLAKTHNQLPNHLEDWKGTHPLVT